MHFLYCFCHTNYSKHERKKNSKIETRTQSMLVLLHDWGRDHMLQLSFVISVSCILMSTTQTMSATTGVSLLVLAFCITGSLNTMRPCLDWRCGSLSFVLHQFSELCFQPPLVFIVINCMVFQMYITENFFILTE